MVEGEVVRKVKGLGGKEYTVRDFTRCKGTNGFEERKQIKVLVAEAERDLMNLEGTQRLRHLIGNLIEAVKTLNENVKWDEPQRK